MDTTVTRRDLTQHVSMPSLASPTLQCLAGKQCSTNSGDLQNVGLPPGSLYGVCQ